MHEKIIICDFGSQYTQLIARRVRELNVYCEIIPYNKVFQLEKNIKGVILSGSPSSVNDQNAPQFDMNIFPENFPVLGICYGAQLIVKNAGGIVSKSKSREYGRAKIFKNNNSILLKNISDESQVWMSHADTIEKMPNNFDVVASSESIPVAAYKVSLKPVYGLQFHPEVTHTIDGAGILKNFLIDICGCKQDWTSACFIDESVKSLIKKLGNDKVVMGVSGGVDSTVAATLIHKAIGKNLYCIFVDNGLLRKNEFESVLKVYKTIGLNVKGVDAGKIFLSELQGVTNPEIKRKIIGKVFIDVFEAESKIIKGVKWLAQGTIYPDIIESVSVKGPAAKIKSHHNVGGLPEKMKLKIVEPLNTLFKDEVRNVGKELGISNKILARHPFPGPGLAVRILGEITEDKIKILQEADDIFINGLIEHKLYDEVWQAGVIFLPVQSVGVMGDERTYENVVSLRAVNSKDGMTADWCHLPYSFLGEISNKIINNVKGINRVVYDISSKPPATIEWE